jgi:Putative transposase DNA-binding domain
MCRFRLEQSRQLTAARAENPWLREGSQTVQQQALRDFAQGMRSFFAGPHRRPTWRKAGRDEGFRVVGQRGMQWDVRRFDVIRIEDLPVKKMTRSAKGTAENPGKNVAQKAGLNREIRRSGWGSLATRLEDKAPGRVEKVTAAYTSQRCSACGHVARENRKSQAAFLCTACNFACNADVNAARNIAAGHAVTARGGFRDAGPMNREPQLLLQSV